MEIYDATFEVASYLCKKAEITVTDKSGTSLVSNIWFTEKIPNHMNINDDRGVQFRDIKGMSLEYEIRAQNGMSMKMTAASISKETVAESKFDIPSDYKETTMEDMQKDMMQKMQQH